MNQLPEELEHLISRAGDGDLSREERAAMNSALARDPALAKAARDYQRLSDLLRHWRVLPAGMDWDAISARTSASLSEQNVAAQSSEVDHLVRAAMPAMPPVNWDRLKARISAAVHQEAALAEARTSHTGRRTLRWFAAVAGPIAVAAALFLTIRGPQSEQAPVIPIARKPSSILVALDVPASAGRVSVSFDQTPFDTVATSDELAPGFAIADGPSASRTPELPDDALLF